MNEVGFLKLSVPFEIYSYYVLFSPPRRGDSGGISTGIDWIERTYTALEGETLRVCATLTCAVGTVLAYAIAVSLCSALWAGVKRLSYAYLNSRVGGCRICGCRMRLSYMQISYAVVVYVDVVYAVAVYAVVVCGCDRYVRVSNAISVCGFLCECRPG